MKNFFTSLLGALAALVIFCGGAAVLGLVTLAAIAALGGDKSQPRVERGAWLVFDLATNIADAPAPINWGGFGDRERTAQLRTITQALRTAATDGRIAGVLLQGELSPAGYGSGYAALHEVREALLAVRAAGKPVKAYLTSVAAKDYYLASTASDLVLDPYGMILLPGLASEPTFFAGAFEKYGVGVQVTRVGKYKSAVEPYTRKEMSPESRAQLQKLLDDVWAVLVADMAKSRGLTPREFQAAVDAEGMFRPDTAKARKLIDRAAYRDEVLAELKKATGRTGAKETFKQINLTEYARLAKPAAGGGKGRVALVYAEGAIVDGEGGPGEIGGEKMARELRKLRQDGDVKAIVLRVNSPGGSASASETIQRELRLARGAKPVIVSMGSYAASGGYWISAYGDRIFAERATITGSIGVFGMQFDVKKLANDFGLTFDSVKTGKFADAVTISRPKTAEELAVVQRMVDWIYGEFIGKVTEGRKLKREFVEEIAQGRVWSGAEAVKLGLVDELGGLDAALAHAAKKGGLGTNFKVSEYPRKKPLVEAVQEMLEKVAPANARLATPGLAGKVWRRLEGELGELKTFNDPQGVYARLPGEYLLR